MKGYYVLSLAAMIASLASVNAFSLSMKSEVASRRSFVGTMASSAAALLTATTVQPTQSSQAAPTIYTLDSGIKYAVKQDANKGYPQSGDIVAIEYTGYLTNGAIFDATHAEGKSNALLFKLGSSAVIPGINQMVAEMKVGQKVQAIIPPSLAFGDKGICLDGGECLVKPGSTLVYDIYLKKSSIPPP